MHCRVVQGIATCTLILLLCSVGSVNGQCGGRCDDNRYCNQGTHVCENCGIYCNPKDSTFANQRECEENCPYVIYGTNKTRACPFACESGFFCEKDLKSCESCEIYCDPDNQIYAEKCPESCTAVESSSPSTESDITTKKDVTNKNEPTPAPLKKDDNKKNKIIISVSVIAGVFCLIGLIYLRKRLCKKYCGKQSPYPVQAQADPMAESNEQEQVLV